MDYELRRVCPLLRGPSNYTVWKSKMEMVLVRERLWSIVCERRTKPESSAKAQTDYDNDAERATATIFLYLSDTAERYVRDLRDPVAVWAKLKEVFSTVGFTARYNMWKTLFRITIGYNTDVVEYLDKVRSVAITLRESGAEVSDEILVTVALQGLGEKFDTLIAVITHSEVPPTFDALTTLLTEEVARKGATEEATAFAVRARDRGGVGVCWHCQKPGHKRDRCFELHPELRNKAPSTGALPVAGGGRGMSPEHAGVAMCTETSW